MKRVFFSPEPWGLLQPRSVDLRRWWQALASILSQTRRRNHTQTLWSAEQIWQPGLQWHRWSCLCHCKTYMSAVSQTPGLQQTWKRHPRLNSLRHASVELPHRGAVKPADLHPHHFAEVHFSDELNLSGSGCHPQWDLSVGKRRSHLLLGIFR